MIEDINRSEQPSELIEKIAGWSVAKTQKSDAPSRWRVFCPAWPQATHGLKEQVRKSIEPTILTCSLMTPAEARAAVQQRGKTQGDSLSTMDADAVATALGFDPLLIALHDVREKPDPHRVIIRFVQGCVRERPQQTRRMQLPIIAWPCWHSHRKCFPVEISIPVGQTFAHGSARAMCCPRFAR